MLKTKKSEFSVTKNDSFRFTAALPVEVLINSSTHGNLLTFFSVVSHCRIEENERMDRREQAKQQQKQQFQQMQRQSQSDNDAPQQPLFGVPKKVSFCLWEFTGRC